MVVQVVGEVGGEGEQEITAGGALLQDVVAGGLLAVYLLQQAADALQAGGAVVEAQRWPDFGEGQAAVGGFALMQAV